MVVGPTEGLITNEKVKVFKDRTDKHVTFVVKGFLNVQYLITVI